MAEDGAAGGADDDSLGVREDGGDVDATGALDVHEEAVGRLHEALKLVLPLLDGGIGVEKVVLKQRVAVNCYGHSDKRKQRGGGQGKRKSR